MDDASLAPAQEAPLASDAEPKDSILQPPVKPPDAQLTDAEIMASFYLFKISSGFALLDLSSVQQHAPIPAAAVPYPNMTI